MPAVVVESLESRTLMADMIGTLAAQVALDVGAIRASVAASVKASPKDQHTLAVDLRRTGTANATLLKTLAKDYRAALANLHIMQNIAGTIGLADTKRADAAVESAIAHHLTTKSVAQMNLALAKLSAEDNLFVSTPIVNAFYAASGQPGTDETQIGTSNPNNAALNAALPAIEADAANLGGINVKFDALVMDVSAFATYIIDNVAGAVF